MVFYLIGLEDKHYSFQNCHIVWFFTQFKIIELKNTHSFSFVKFFTEQFKLFMIDHQSQALNLSQNLINFISQIHVLLLYLALSHTFSYRVVDFLIFIECKSLMHHMNLNYLTWMNFMLRKIFLIFVKLCLDEILDSLQFFYFFISFNWDLQQTSFKYLLVCFW